MRGVAAQADSGGLGLPGRAGDDDGAALYFEVSREEVQLWVPGMPEFGRPGRNLEIAAAGRDWRAVDGGLHDGP